MNLLRPATWLLKHLYLEPTRINGHWQIISSKRISRSAQKGSLVWNPTPLEIPCKTRTFLWTLLTFETQNPLWIFSDLPYRMGIDIIFGTAQCWQLTCNEPTWREAKHVHTCKSFLLQKVKTNPQVVCTHTRALANRHLMHYRKQNNKIHLNVRFLQLIIKKRVTSA